MEQIHARLSEELKRLNLSMADAAREIGEESSQGIRDVCSGRKRASAELVAKLALIGADALYILTGVRVGEMKFSPEIPLTITREEAAFLDNYRHSPKDAQESMKTMCAALAQRGVKKSKAA